MPRNWTRKTSKASWTAGDLQAAAVRIRGGVSIRKVAEETGIPFSTLQRRIKKDEFKPLKLGRHTVFNEDQEKILTERILQLSNMFHGLTTNQLRKITFQCAENLKLSHNFNRETRMAGRDWIQGFLKRNPRISIRKPEAISIQRITGFNKTDVHIFFKNLEEVMTKISFSTQDIYNIDETGITTVQETEKILATKGQKRVGSLTSWERGKTITVICCMSAVGSFIPPMFIYPRKRHSPQLEKDGPLSAAYENSNNGWTNEELFMKWLQHFVKTAKPRKEKPVLLILDNHYSHSTLESYNFCRENFITVVSIPPHTSHMLQPLDVVFYGPLKKAYNRECDLYIKSHNLQKITPYEVAGIFNKAYMKVASVEKGVSGFASTGIFPLNPHKFKDEDFLDVSDVPCVIEISAPITDLTVIEVSDNLSTNNISEATALTNSRNALEPQPSTSAIITNYKSNDGINQENKKSDSEPITGILSQLTPLPCIGKGKGKGKRSQRSEILTATPLKTVFEEKAKKRKEKEKHTRGKFIKKIKEVKKNLFKSSSSEESADEQVPYVESGDSDLENIEIPLNIQQNSQNEREHSVCAICLEEGKPREIWYRCRLCAGWAHEACTGCDDPSRYRCDFCI